jgi:hypothetical protein
VRSYNQPECCGTAPSDPDDVGEARPHVVERPPQAIEPIRTRTELPSPPALLDSQWKTLYLVKALLKADSDKVLASYWIREQNTLTHRIHVTHKASSCRTVRTSGKTFIVLFLFVLLLFFVGKCPIWCASLRAWDPNPRPHLNLCVMRRARWGNDDTVHSDA